MTEANLRELLCQLNTMPLETRDEEFKARVERMLVVRVGTCVLSLGDELKQADDASPKHTRMPTG
jgi:hypothetical protein